MRLGVVILRRMGWRSSTWHGEASWGDDEAPWTPRKTRLAPRSHAESDDGDAVRRALARSPAVRVGCGQIGRRIVGQSGAQAVFEAEAKSAFVSQHCAQVAAKTEAAEILATRT